MGNRYGAAISLRRMPICAPIEGRRIQIRRGEVVFAIRQCNGEILLHTKHRYETPIYRLPTGRIERGESVEDALYREIAEETGQLVQLRRFLGVLDCHFVNQGSNIPFVSYIFYLESLSKELRPTDTEEIAGYRTVPARELCAVAQTLRNLQSHRPHVGLLAFFGARSRPSCLGV